MKRLYQRFEAKVGRLLQAVRRAFWRSRHARTCGVLCPAGIFALARLPCGVCAMVKTLELAPEAANRLRQMGIREGCQICLLNNDPLLISVDNARIAIGPSLAEQIKVESVK